MMMCKFTRNIAAHNFSTDDPHVTNSFLDNSSITEISPAIITDKVIME